MKRRVQTICTAPILRTGSVKLTAQDNRILLRELVGQHMNTFLALSQLGFVVVGHEGPNYQLRHRSKGLTVILKVAMNDLPKSLRQIVVEVFQPEARRPV